MSECKTNNNFRICRVTLREEVVIFSIQWLAGKSDFNENPVVSLDLELDLDLDLDFGLRLRVCQ